MESEEPLVVVAGFYQDDRTGKISECFSCSRAVILDKSDCDRADLILCPVCGQAGIAYKENPVAM